MMALIAPLLPYIIGALVALIGGGGFILKTKHDARKAGIAEQQAKEARANAQDLNVIHAAAGAQPAGSVRDDPNNRDNAKG